MDVVKSGRSTDRWLILGGLATIGVTTVALMFVVPWDKTTFQQPARSFSIPSASMEPTLHIGERVFANMRAYEAQPPARGDIVVVTVPRDASTFYIKRIIGLPGESVQLVNGVVQINGQAIPTADAGTYRYSHSGQAEQQGTLKRESPPNGASYTTLDLIKNGPYDSTKVYQIPDGHYFLLGDNRDNSVDSRVDKFGYIPQANVLGKISWVFWSPDLSRIGTK